MGTLVLDAYLFDFLSREGIRLYRLVANVPLRAGFGMDFYSEEIFVILSRDRPPPPMSRN
jgi:hypothetical protein